MMCSVLALNTASTGATGQGCSRASSAMGARRLAVPSSRMRSASGASCSPSSLGCQVRCGRRAAKYTACWPVPLPSSRTLPLVASSLLRTSRIGPLLRSQASDSTSTARVCDNTPMQAIDALLKRRSARELTEQTLSAGAAAHAMMLAAFALGFNAMWKTGGPAYDETVKQALGFASTDAIVGFLYLGTETAPAAAPARGEWRDLVRYWGEQA